MTDSDTVLMKLRAGLVRVVVDQPIGKIPAGSVWWVTPKD